MHNHTRTPANKLKATAAALAMFFILLIPQPAHALFGVGDVSITAGDIPRTIERIFTGLYKKFGAQAFHQALRSVTYRFAQETAVWIASGDRGRKPLLIQKGLKDGLLEAGDEVAGKFLVNIASREGGLPVDLCSSNSMKNRSLLVLGVSKSIQDFNIFDDLIDNEIDQDVGKKGCNLSEIIGNSKDAVDFYKKSASGLKDLDLKNLAKGFEPGKGDLSTFLVLRENVSEEKERTKLQVTLDKEKGATDSKDPQGQPSGTNAEQVQNAQRLSQEKFWPDPTVTGDIFVDAFQIFTNTLMQTYLSRLQGGFYPLQRTRSPGSLISDVDVPVGSRQALLASFGDFSPEQVVSIGSPGEIDLFGDMASCPPGQYQNPYHCLLNAGMQQAVQQRLTVQQAMNTGLLDPNMLFPEQHSDDQANLSLLNLRKLRFLRVLPLGWELAAQRAKDDKGQSRLGDIVRCFEDPEAPLDPKRPYNCPRMDPSGQPGTNPDTENRYYHLIDPNWLLDLPQQFCRAEGYGTIPEHERSPNRTESCVDLLSCIKEDARGDCKAFGYCTRERVVFGITGNTCESEYATCRTFSQKSGGTVSLLTSSLNADKCNLPNAAGCKWYSAAKTANEDPADPTDDWQIGNSARIYLNQQAKQCSIDERGSLEVVPVLPGVNLIKNGDFKENNFEKQVRAGGGNPAIPPFADGGWEFRQSQQLDSGSEPAYLLYDENFSIEAIAPLEAAQTVALAPASYYTLSFEAQAVRGNTQADITITKLDSQRVLRSVSFHNPAIYAYGDFTLTNQLSFRIPSVPASGRTRYAMTLYNASTDIVSIEVLLKGGVLYDNVQLEMVSLLDGQRADQAVVLYLNDPDSANDGSLEKIRNLNEVPSRTEARGALINAASPTTQFGPYEDFQKNKRYVFAQADTCAGGAEESTARKYIPASGPLRTPKIARVTPGGLCSQQCSGLDRFLQMPTPIELQRYVNARPSAVRFIPGEAQSCNAAQVGCEVFTNISGGTQEQREYFSRIESCVLDTNPNSSTFFTWEGSDTAGYQLKAWQLLRDHNSNGPCTEFPQGSRRDPATTSCDDNTQGSTGGVSTPSPSCTPDPLDPADTCRVFLDQNGVEYYRDAAKIVTTSSECTSYRRTALSGGATTQENWYFVPREANRCSAQAVGCKEYKGRGANKVTQIIFDDFEANREDWQLATGDTISDRKQNAVETGQYSLLIDNNKSVGKNTHDLIADSGNVPADYRFEGRTYLVKFSAKQASGNAYINRIWVGNAVTERQFPSDDYDGSNNKVILTDEWAPYVVGPLTITIPHDAIGSLKIEVAGGQALIDKIELLEVPDAQYLLSQSILPESQGGSQPDACIAPGLNRCQPYRDENSNTYYISRFEKLFDERALSCTAVINTQNSASPYSQRYNSQDPVSQYDVSADALEYRYLERSRAVSRDAKGCTELGFQYPDSAGTLRWRSEYLTVDPDQFLTTLCRSESVGCEAYATADGGSYVFRDPGNQLCVWDPGFAGGAGGWVTKGTTNACPPTYARECVPEADTCTAYLPVADNLTEGSKTALFMLADSVNTGDCSGQNLTVGCVNFKAPYSDGSTILASKLPGAEMAIRTLKTESNRQCAEWLAPTTTSEVDDPRSRTTRVVSYDLGRCQELGAQNTCVSWIDPTDTTNYPKAYQSGTAAASFDSYKYQQRYGTQIPAKTIYSGAWEYTGYSIPAQYPVEELRQYPGDQSVAGISLGQWQCDFTCTINVLSVSGSPFSNKDLSGKYVVIESGDAAKQIRKIQRNDASSITVADNNPFGVDLDNALFRIVDGSQIECRAYPEEDAPFSRESLQERAAPYTSTNTYTSHPELKSVSLCEDKGLACDCSYKKVETFDQPLYFSQSTSKPFPEDALSITDLTGWQGYCVERDHDTLGPNDDADGGACLAWLPIDVVQSSINIFDNNPQAGFSTSQPLYYCLDAKSNFIKYDDFGLTESSNPSDEIKLHFIEAKENVYQISVATGDNGNGRIPAFGEHFVRGTGWVRHQPVKLGPASGSDYGYTLLYHEKTSNEGPENSSGLMQFPVKVSSPLSRLHEYDIEAIVLKTRASEHKAEWPGTGEEFPLTRMGTAKSIFTSPDIEIDNEWTALWCGGKEDGKCDFGGEYSWNKFTPYLENLADDFDMYYGSRIETADSDRCYSGHKQKENLNDPGIIDTIDQSGSTNLFAVRAVFADGEGTIPNKYEHFVPVVPSTDIQPYQFLGFEGGICDNTGSGGWVDFEIVFMLREWCSTVTLVDTGGENKAWTGRLAGKPQVKSGQCKPGSDPRADRFCYTDADCGGAAGSCGISFEQQNGDGYIKGVYPASDGLFTIKEDSSPFGAIVPPTGEIYDPTKWDSRNDTYDIEQLKGTQTVTETRPLEPGLQPLYVEQRVGKESGQVRAGTPIGCRRGGECIIPPTKEGKERTKNFEGATGGLKALRNLFARVYGVWRFSTSMVQYMDITGDTSFSLDYTGTDDAGQCPVISAIINDAGEVPVFNFAEANPHDWNPLVNDSGVATGFNCPVGANPARAGRYSINNQAIQHANGNVQTGKTILVQLGEEVRLQFYAYNYNGEQLPIKKITIDWGDQGQQTVVTGSFKNHRPDCDDSGANFGQLSRACDSGAFEFMHVYRTIGKKWPTVTVEDNWGRKTDAMYNNASGRSAVLEVQDASRDIPIAFNAPAQSGSSFNFSWTATPPELDVANFQIRVTKATYDGNIIQDPVSVISALGANPTYTGSVSVSAASDIAVVTISVQGCTADSTCGAEYRATAGKQPRQVQNLRVNSSANAAVDVDQNGSVSFSWSALPEAESYQLALVRTPGGLLTPQGILSSPYGYAYEAGTMQVIATVRACNAVSGCGPYSVAATIRYKPTALAAPSFQPAYLTSGQPVTFSWVANQIADSYRFQHRYPPSAAWSEETTTTTSRIVQLPSGADDIAVRVAACNQALCSDFSQETTATVSPFAPYFVSQAMTWDNARAYCASQNGHLVTIGNETENNIVKGLVSGASWIGLNDKSQENTYVWTSGFTTPLYRKWQSGEPNNLDDEDCVEFYTGSGNWNDNKCGLSRPFVCNPNQ